MNEYSKVGWQDGTVLQPATVTIDGTDYEVDPAVESGTTPVNATNLDKMDTALKQAHDGVRSLSTNKIDKATIELLTVSDTAPSECTTGDMYYNTTTNYIYTAIATDTWSETGELPSSKYLYVDLENSKLYYYDGTNFTSYGGGASNDVIISDTEPTEPDNKLWIDTGEIAQQVSEITNSYSTSTGLGYSANYINNTMPTISNATSSTTTWGTVYFQKIGDFVMCWGHLASLTGTYKTISIPSGYGPKTTFNYFTNDGYQKNHNILVEFNSSNAIYVLGILPNITDLSSANVDISVVYRVAG